MIDAFAESHGIPMNTAHSKAIFGKGFVCEVPVFLAKPQTYMNLSGESVLKSELEKASPALGRGATYLKESRIKVLPRSKKSRSSDIYLPRDEAFGHLKLVAPYSLFFSPFLTNY